MTITRRADGGTATPPEMPFGAAAGGCVAECNCKGVSVIDKEDCQLTEVDNEIYEKLYLDALSFVSARREGKSEYMAFVLNRFQQSMTPDVYLKLDNRISVLSVIVKEQTDEINQLLEVLASKPKGKMNWLNTLLSKLR